MNQGKTTSYDIEEISLRLAERLPELIEELGITFKYIDTPDHVSMACPIHDGDNPQGFSMLKRGVGNWICFTHQCHEKYGTKRGASLISFIQAYRNIPYKAAVEWAAKFTGVKASTIDNLASSEEKNKFIQTVKLIAPTNVDKKQILTKSYLRQSIEIPANYFRNRGFCPSVLNTYDVGTCTNPSKPYYNRVIVPLYDDDGNTIVACTSRSIYDICKVCGFYHASSVRCPITNQEKLNACKWRNTSSNIFDSYLYNFWIARNSLKNDAIILVEGVPDVWRLVEAGITNAVALLGTKFTTNQRKKIEASGATTVIIGTDNDEAGNDARIRIRNECSRFFNVYDVFPSKKDFGDMSAEEIRKVFKEYI